MCWLCDCLLRRMFWNNKLKFVLIYHMHLPHRILWKCFCVDVLKNESLTSGLKIRHVDFVPWFSCCVVDIFVCLYRRNNLYDLRGCCEISNKSLQFVVQMVVHIYMFTVIYTIVGKFAVGDIYLRKQVGRANWILPVNLLLFKNLWKAHCRGDKRQHNGLGLLT